jgi:hypothetical protein
MKPVRSILKIRPSGWCQFINPLQARVMNVKHSNESRRNCVCQTARFSPALSRSSLRRGEPFQLSRSKSKGKFLLGECV